MKPTFEYRDPAKLKNHPLSIELYGETIDGEFVEAVRLAGEILQPIRILGRGAAYPEGTVIDGRRRRIVAAREGFDKVPVLVMHDLKDKLLIDRQVILSNKPNDKTVEQRAREFAKLKEIESEMAAIRMKQAPIKAKGLSGDAKANLPEQAGQSADIAADAVGMSRHTAEKALEVVEEIDDLKAKGQTKKADELREKLESSVSAAHREVMGEPEPKSLKDDSGNEVPDKLRSVFEMRDEFDVVLKRLLPGIGERAIEIQRKLYGKKPCPPNGFSANKVSDALKVIHKLFETHRPRQVCDNCLGPRCTRCRGRGWK